jgi:hypothetical protein
MGRQQLVVRQSVGGRHPDHLLRPTLLDRRASERLANAKADAVRQRAS